MFHSYYAHSLDQLAHRFSLQLDSGSGNPLEPVWVIVQNNEIKEWLSLKVAERQGIAGNFRFIFPSEFLWTLYRLVEDDIPKVLPSDLNSMQWTLFELLGQNPALLKHIPFYDETEDSQSKRFQLSGQLADILDQYQVYRPGMLQNWLEGKPTTNHPDEKWQLILWRSLNEYWHRSKTMKSLPSRSGAYQGLVKWLDEGNQDLLAALPEHVYVFGLSHLSQPFLEIIGRISQHKPVHFFNRRIASSVGSNEINSIISDWNKATLGQHELLDAILKEMDIEQNIAKEEKEQFSIPKLAVHSCHGARREVEVLKDSILHFLEKNPGSSPKDILVMVPDADEYASLIESVFEDEEAPALPVSRLSGKKRQSPDYALITIMDVLQSSYKPSRVLEVVNLEPIKKAYSFSDDELTRVEEWIIEENVHRGLGDQFNSAYSWQKMSNELMAGLAMEQSELEIYKGLVPYNGISSGDDMQLAARFSAFVDTLKSAADEVQKPKDSVSWLEFMEGIVKSFMDFGENAEDYSRLYKQLSRLKQQVAYSGSNELVESPVIKSWLNKQLESSSSSSGRFGQGITVSSYVPYRSVPFKFIAVLGLNEGVFPRQAVRPEYDLIYAAPKPGDRIQKDDDTYLFLETLASARDHLHLSYRGQDLHSDTDRLPSMLVQQLIDVLSGKEYTFKKHSLHPFNTRYFEEGSDRRSYSRVQKNLAESLQSNDGDIPDFITSDFVQSEVSGVEEVSISSLISFFQHPSKWFVSNYLGLSDKTYINEISDREVFDLDGLQNYKFKDFLLKQRLADHPKEQVFKYASTRSMIPDKLKGEKVFESEFEAVNELIETVKNITDAEEQSVEIDLEVSGIQITGTITGIYNEVLVYFRTGKRKPAYEVEHWMSHILLLASGYPLKKSLFVSKEKEGVEILEIRSDVIPKGIVDELLKWYVSDIPMLKKTSFFPETSKAYAEEWIKIGDENKALNKARYTWEPNYNRTWVESNDFFNELIWRNRDPLVLDEFKVYALRFWEPFLKVVEDSKHEE